MWVNFSLCAGILILIGLDCKISAKRWKAGFKDLNPILQYAVKNHGVIGGIAALLVLNLAILALLSEHTILLSILFGGKLSLATLQIRSLIENGKHAL